MVPGKIHVNRTFLEYVQRAHIEGITGSESPASVSRIHEALSKPESVGVGLQIVAVCRERENPTRALVGIVTVPAAAAQEVTEQLTSAGIRAIWNFSPANLEVPESVVVQNVRFVDSLAVLSQRLNQLASDRGDG